MSIYKEPTTNFVSTTLNGSINDAVDTITLNDASKLQYPGYVVIDREDGNGTATPNSREVVSYTGISGNTLTGCTRGADSSTARSHSDGALVEATITVGMWSGLRTAFTDVFGTSGTEFNISAATITGLTNLGGIAVSSVASVRQGDFINIGVSSIASIARVESSYIKGINGVFSSIASIARIETPRIEYAVSRMALNSNASGGVACDFDTANLFTRVLNASTTITLSNWSTGDKGVVRLVQGISGASVLWNPGAGTTINWNLGVAPSLTYKLNKVDVFGFIGATDTRIDGFTVGKNL